jgi:hypothetical protein
MPHPRYLVTLEALPDENNVPVPIRLRHFLKTALRAYRLRCRRIEQVADGNGAVVPEIGEDEAAVNDQ